MALEGDASAIGCASFLLHQGHALFEARRCLRCYDAPCTHACPAGVDVPGFISRLAEENYAGSYEMLAASNPLPEVCGLVCPTTTLCEGACVLSRLGQRPIQIGALQHYVAAHYQQPEREPTEVGGCLRRVAVIGAGPSGLSCAVVLRRLGYGVTLFDRAPTLGGFLSQVIPAWRLPQSAVTHELARLRAMGIEFRLGEEIDVQRAGELPHQYDAVYVAVGLGQSPALSLPGADLPGVGSALDFLRQARRAMDRPGEPPVMGTTVVVVGGGNVALDAAVAALRLGAMRAVVLYRRTLAEMPAWRSEYLEAANLGVEFRWLSTPTSIHAAAGQVSAVEVQPMRLTTPGTDGRRGVEPDPRAIPYELACDTVLLALGQGLEPQIAEALGLPINAGGTLTVERVTGRSLLPNVFAGGDAVNGGTTVVQAVANGVAAAQAIAAQLSRQGEC